MQTRPPLGVAVAAPVGTVGTDIDEVATPVPGIYSIEAYDEGGDPYELFVHNFPPQLGRFHVLLRRMSHFALVLIETGSSVIRPM
jgi:hypothetical protein